MGMGIWLKKWCWANLNFNLRYYKENKVRVNLIQIVKYYSFRQR